MISDASKNLLTSENKNSCVELTIFANFFIDTEERFLRMKDSFESMSKIKVDQWVVNIRGSYSDDAVVFFKSKLSKMVLLNIDSGNWFYDSLQMSRYIKTGYVLTWLEDTICMNPSTVNRIVSEMFNNSVEILNPTYWCGGYSKRRYEGVTELHHGNDIDFFDHTAENNLEVQSNKFDIQSYIIGYMSIIQIDLFVRVLLDNGSDSRWSKNTPYGFEKGPYDIHWLPFRRGVPQVELFASIDDNHAEAGSCLQDRGLYPFREGRRSYAFDTRNFFKKVYDKLKIVKVINLYKIIINSLKVPINKKIDYLTSHHGFDTNENKEIKRMSYACISYLNKLKSNPEKSFQYGSGDLDILFGITCNEMVAVESLKSIYIKTIENFNVTKNITYDLAEPKIINRKLHDSLDYMYTCKSEEYKGYNFNAYVNYIDKYPDNYFDLIIISNYSKIECLLKSIHKLKNNGIILVNNVDDKTTRFFNQNSKMFLFTVLLTGPVKGLIEQQSSSISKRNHLFEKNVLEDNKC